MTPHDMTSLTKRWQIALIWTQHNYSAGRTNGQFPATHWLTHYITSHITHYTSHTYANSGTISLERTPPVLSHHSSSGYQCVGADYLLVESDLWSVVDEVRQMYFISTAVTAQQGDRDRCAADCAAYEDIHLLSTIIMIAPTLVNN